MNNTAVVYTFEDFHHFYGIVQCSLFQEVLLQLTRVNEILQNEFILFNFKISLIQVLNNIDIVKSWNS